MFVIKASIIKPGDIILTRSNDRLSEMVRSYTQSDYSHAILYVGQYSCIESDGLGVQARNLQRIGFENESDVVLLRLLNSKDNSIISKAIEFARQKIGTEYSTYEAKLVKIETDSKAKEPNRQFCTRFVAQAYAESGLKLVNNADYCTPQNILESEKVERVKDFLKIASDEEIALVNEKNTPLDIQTDIHNMIFDEARRISGEDIQTFEQLGKFVIENPDKEPLITEAVVNSGYLKMWETDIQKNPWHYDYKELIKQYRTPEHRRYVGNHFATSEIITRQRFILTLEALEYGYSFHKQNYFKLMIELYNKLIELSLLRESVGKETLKKN